MTCSHCSASKVFSRGLCRSCYDRLRRRGTLERKNVSNVGKPCAHEGCCKRPHAGGFCSTHYQRARGKMRSLWRNLRHAAKGQYPPEWDRYEVFIKAVGSPPSDAHQLRRLDHTRPWGHGNMVWRDPISHGKWSGTPEERAEYARAWSLRKNYGLTPQDVEDMKRGQDGLCPICERDLEREGAKMCVDHDHYTGEVRGLLCDDCNKGIGQLGDDPERLKRALEYLLRHRHKKPPPLHIVN